VKKYPTKAKALSLETSRTPSAGMASKEGFVQQQQQCILLPITPENDQTT